MKCIVGIGGPCQFFSHHECQHDQRRQDHPDQQPAQGAAQLLCDPPGRLLQAPRPNRRWGGRLQAVGCSGVAGHGGHAEHRAGLDQQPPEVRPRPRGPAGQLRHPRPHSGRLPAVQLRAAGGLVQPAILPDRPLRRVQVEEEYPELHGPRPPRPLRWPRVAHVPEVQAGDGGQRCGSRVPGRHEVPGGALPPGPGGDSELTPEPLLAGPEEGPEPGLEGHTDNPATGRPGWRRPSRTPRDPFLRGRLYILAARHRRAPGSRPEMPLWPHSSFSIKPDPIFLTVGVQPVVSKVPKRTLLLASLVASGGGEDIESSGQSYQHDPRGCLGFLAASVPVDRASACGLKGPRFDSGQRHVPWLWAHPQ